MMIDDTNAFIPPICVPDAIPAGERAAHFELVNDLFNHRVQARTDVPNGFAFRFLQSDFESLARFIGNERKCCPAIQFELEVAADGGPIWLRMTGPQNLRRS